MRTIHLGRREKALSPIESVKSSSGAPTKKMPVHYPTLHLSGEGKQFEDLHKLPESGTMHVKYHVHARESRNSSDGKTKTHGVELKIHHIVSAESDKAEPSGEEALDSLALDAKNSKGGNSAGGAYVGQNIGMHTP